MMKILIIDNYDSFTYNLRQALEQTGLCSVAVSLNDRVDVDSIRQYAGVLISPGPGLPAEAGMTLDVIRAFGDRIPILGICLGMQAIAEVFGARLQQLSEPQHGRSVQVRVTASDEPLFAGLADTFRATLYHSWGVEPLSVTSPLKIIAEGNQGQVMALRHMHHPVAGFQFHPESYATAFGPALIRNWLMEIRRHTEWQ